MKREREREREREISYKILRILILFCHNFCFPSIFQGLRMEKKKDQLGV